MAQDAKKNIKLEADKWQAVYDLAQRLSAKYGTTFKITDTVNFAIKFTGDNWQEGQPNA